MGLINLEIVETKSFKYSLTNWFKKMTLVFTGIGV